MIYTTILHLRFYKRVINTIWLDKIKRVTINHVKEQIIIIVWADPLRSHNSTVFRSQNTTSSPSKLKTSYRPMATSMWTMLTSMPSLISRVPMFLRKRGSPGPSIRILVARIWQSTGLIESLETLTSIPTNRSSRSPRNFTPDQELSRQRLS